MNTASPRRGDESSPGTVPVGDRYALTRRLAVGGMGEVWQATDTVLGREVAVKILRDDLVDSATFLDRFRAEARHTAGLAHPGIASVYDYGEEDVDGHLRAFLVMELVRGEAMSHVLAQRGPFGTETTLSLLAQAAEALHAAHVNGVVHRDVKPGNLMLLDDGTLKVTDFGIARAADSAAITEAGQVIGTAQYMSPEQALGREATAASDVYSLGIIGYEMLAGRPPFTGSNPGALAMAHVHQVPPPLPSNVPQGVRDLILSAVAKDPLARPADALAFASQARRLQLLNMPPPGHVNVDAAATVDERAALAAGLAETLVGTGVHVAEWDVATDVADGAVAGPATEIMPSGGVAVAAPRIIITQQPDDTRRRRNGLWVVLGIAALMIVLALSRAVSGPSRQPLDGTTLTTVGGATTTVVTVPPAVTTVVAPAPTPPTTTVKHKGKGPKGP